MKLPAEFRSNVFASVAIKFVSIFATIWFSIVSRQFAAFHQPELVHKPFALLYHC